jgi:dynein heavy chain
MWPSVVADDLVSHVQQLKTAAHVVAGQIKGQTLLPLPVGTDMLDESGSTRSFDPLEGEVDRSVVHAIETAVIDWSYQVSVDGGVYLSESEKRKSDPNLF